MLKNSEITEITGLSSNQQFRIKTNIKIEDTTEISNIIMNTLKDFNPEIRAIESVGPKSWERASISSNLCYRFSPFNAYDIYWI